MGKGTEARGGRKLFNFPTHLSMVTARDLVSCWSQAIFRDPEAASYGEGEQERVEKNSQRSCGSSLDLQLFSHQVFKFLFYSLSHQLTAPESSRM